jgi:hypothetical protein
MRCVCCDKALNDFEATRRSTVTNEFLDMCNKCYLTIARVVPSLEREDLLTNEERTEEEDLENE